MGHRGPLPAGRPAWEDVGAQFVEDVAPYEFMKLRLLNASHLAVAGLGRLTGYVTIDEAMADPLIARYMIALMDRETGPTLPAVPGIDLPRYKATLVGASPIPRSRTQSSGSTRMRHSTSWWTRSGTGSQRASRWNYWRWPWLPGCAGCVGKTSRACLSRCGTHLPNNCA